MQLQHSGADGDGPLGSYQQRKEPFTTTLGRSSTTTSSSDGPDVERVCRRRVPLDRMAGPRSVDRPNRGPLVCGGNGRSSGPSPLFTAWRAHQGLIGARATCSDARGRFQRVRHDGKDRDHRGRALRAVVVRDRQQPVSTGTARHGPGVDSHTDDNDSARAVALRVRNVVHSQNMPGANATQAAACRLW